MIESRTNSIDKTKLMKPRIELTKAESGKLFAAMLKNLPCEIFILDHDADNIIMAIEMKLGETTIVCADCVMCRFDWVRLMEQIKPYDTVGTEEIHIDWWERSKDELIDDLRGYVDELLSKIECFEITVTEI
jgi:hypothetical protein